MSDYVTVVASPTGGDDTAAIHAARDAAGTNGKVYFPENTYRTGGLLANLPGQVWELHPRALVKAADSATASVIDIRAPGVSVTGGTIDGNRPTVTSTNVVGIFSGSVVTGTVVTGVRVQNCAGYGIWLNDNSGYRVENCTVTGTALTGIITQATTVNVVDGTVHDNTVDRSSEDPSVINTHGLTVRGGSGHTQSRAAVSGNHVLMPLAPTNVGNGAICIEMQAADSSISGNFTYQGAMGISLTGSARVSASGNSIYGPASSATEQYGIELAGSSHCAVTGNVIEGLNALTHGIGFSQAGSNDCTISGNTVRQTTIAGVNVAGGCIRPVISGNNLYTNTGSGIRIANGPNDAVIAGNVINGNGSGGAVEGIRVWSLSTAVVGVLIASNRIVGFPKGIAIVGAGALVTDRIMATGNDLTGCSAAWAETYSGGASLGPNVKIRSNLNLADN